MAYSIVHFRVIIFITIKGKASHSERVIGFICWIVASVSTLGSLFFSEIVKYLEV